MLINSSASWPLVRMAPDPKFGPAAQTPRQRAYVLRQLQAVNPRLRTAATAYAQQLYAGYIAGELSWGEVRSALDVVRQLPASR